MVRRFWVKLLVIGAGIVFGPNSSKAVLPSVFNMPAGQKSQEFVTIGDLGNPADTRITGIGTTGYGSVPYEYRIGKYDVTSAQYAAFLNAVASQSDPHLLYHPLMANTSVEQVGCGIIATGTAQGTNYSVVPGFENLPVSYVSWGDAVRYANWLTNGQPTGTQNMSTTEDGSYTLFRDSRELLMEEVVRRPDARFVLPSADEWYKAAYYKGGQSGAYWKYATQSDTLPSNALDPLGTNNANYFHSYTTDVGFFAGSPSFYGTFDQCGNVNQWLETQRYPMRYIWGGAFMGGTVYLAADAPDFGGESESMQYGHIGFRVAEVPEPASLSLLAMGTLALVRRSKRG